ncbi:hypothetical protein [Pseudonocardia sp. TRM90224]|uniref:hypothetical protein n=1 Tax=Pseudonocardia sp. TRM90224 TaxID=2812678 RepID=UPI001E392B6D|nr:hypothetical protein [Pseudonocardia sp. TRM90224]
MPSARWSRSAISRLDAWNGVAGAAARLAFGSVWAAVGVHGGLHVALHLGLSAVLLRWAVRAGRIDW